MCYGKDHDVGIGEPKEFGKSSLVGFSSFKGWGFVGLLSKHCTKKGYLVFDTLNTNAYTKSQ